MHNARIVISRSANDEKSKRFLTEFILSIAEGFEMYDMQGYDTKGNM